ncbi:hypothetical protein CPC08DRAFT_472519 [Agrocybe pediades]|nr:hypothetical protein CPC08DRAFT_472519 [Agrocybe pediades]
MAFLIRDSGPYSSPTRARSSPRYLFRDPARRCRSCWHLSSQYGGLTPWPPCERDQPTRDLFAGVAWACNDHHRGQTIGFLIIQVTQFHDVIRHSTVLGEMHDWAVCPAALPCGQYSALCERVL